MKLDIVECGYCRAPVAWKSKACSYCGHYFNVDWGQIGRTTTDRDVDRIIVKDSFVPIEKKTGIEWVHGRVYHNRLTVLVCDNLKTVDKVLENGFLNIVGAEERAALMTRTDIESIREHVAGKPRRIVTVDLLASIADRYNEIIASSRGKATDDTLTYLERELTTYVYMNRNEHVKRIVTEMLDNVSEDIVFIERATTRRVPNSASITSYPLSHIVQHYASRTMYITPDLNQMDEILNSLPN